MCAAKPTISFEYFPPKTDKGLQTLMHEVGELVKLRPRFMTVTYGAGGSTREGTINTVKKIWNAHKVPTGSHLTYINTTKEELDRITDDLWDAGIRHIVALRGDMPSDLSWPLDPDADYYQFTSDFVEGIRRRHPFEISVGAYPEKHPDSPDVSADVYALKKKFDSGADRGITQFFFDNEVYYKFLEEAAKEGLNKPIVPGLLPISDYEKMLKFADMCQATVPHWLREKFEKFTDSDGDYLKLATDILAEQVDDLTANGVQHLHFYTLNKAGLTEMACKKCKLG